MLKKSVKTKFIFILFALALILISAVCGIFSADTASAASVDNNYRFNTVSVDITVNKDKTFAVKETLEVRFLESGINTGIIRDIQRVSKTTRIVNGKEKNGGTYIAGISDVSVTYDGGECKVTESLYNNGEFHSVKMQQPSGFIEKGNHTFVLSYIYDMHDDKVAGFDDFTFDVLGYAMAFTSSFYATVTFPAGTDLSNVTFRTNDKKTWRPAASEYAKVEDNVISIHANPQAAEVGYTVQVLLDDGYFEGAHKTFYWYYVIFAVIAFASIVAVAVIVIKSLPKRPVETVEFYPPEGMSVMRFASVWRLGAKNKDAAALILKWAGMGILTITADGKYDCILKANVSADSLNGKCFASDAEKLYFDTLFSGLGGEDFTFSTRRFKNSATSAQKKELYEATERLIREGDSKPSEAVEEREKYRTLVLFLCLVPSVAAVIYYCILNASALPLMFLLFMVVGNLPILQVENMKMVIPIIFPIAFYGFIFGAFYAIFGLTAYDYCGLMYIAPVMWFLGDFVLRFLMPDRRMPSVMSDYGKMRGFKRFLLTAELPRIQLLFDENPSYFADILPYCLIMGISEKVKKRFASLNIRVPEYIAQGINLHSVSSSISSSGSAGAPRSSGGGGGHGGSSGGGGGGGGSRGC